MSFKDVSAAKKEKQPKIELEDVVAECNAISQEWLRKHRVSMTDLIHEHPHRNPQELQIEYLEAKCCTILSILVMMFQGDYQKVSFLLEKMFASPTDSPMEEEYE